MAKGSGDMGGVRRFWLNAVCGSSLWSSRVRVRLLRLGGIQADGAGVRAAVTWVGGPNVHLAEGVFVNSGVFLDGAAAIRVERNVALAPGVKLLTSTHDLGPGSRRAGNGRSVHAPIRIGDGCWVGANAVVLPGVVIHSGCVIAAGAVVTSDCEPNGLYAGVPARRVRDLAEPSV